MSVTYLASTNTFTHTLCAMRRFSVDKEDHSYLQQKLASKEDELNAMISSSYQQESSSVRQVWRKSFHSATHSTPTTDWQ